MATLLSVNFSQWQQLFTRLPQTRSGVFSVALSFSTLAKKTQQKNSDQLNYISSQTSNNILFYNNNNIAKYCSINNTSLKSLLSFNNKKYTQWSREIHTCNIFQNKAVSKNVRKDVAFSEKAREATKTTYYGLVILVGLVLTGGLAYAIFGHLFASFSPQKVYSDAVEKCVNHPRVQDMLGGDSIMCYGEESRRRRRQHVSHLTYEVDGQRGMRIMFHLKGSRRAAKAQLDARQGSSGWYYRYLFVQMDQYPNQIIVIQDNRGMDLDNSGGSASRGSDVDQLSSLYPSSS